MFWGEALGVVNHTKERRGFNGRLGEQRRCVLFFQILDPPLQGDASVKGFCIFHIRVKKNDTLGTSESNLSYQTSSDPVAETAADVLLIKKDLGEKNLQG